MSHPEARSLLLRFTVSVLATVIVGASCFGRQDANTLDLSGTVTDQQARRIAAASVEVIRSGESMPVAATKTDSEGRFKVHIALGRYRLLISANGFEDSARDLDTRSLSSADLQIALTIKPLRSTVTVHGEQGGIVVAESSVGSLTPTPIWDLPQSVQVVNRELLDEQKVYQYADALSYITGVQRAYTSIAGGVGNEVAMRGFNLDYNNNYLRDGFKYYGLSLSDTADVEAVEVLKGPASALYGTAEAGGIVNLITKKPTDAPAATLSMTGGGYRFLRPDFDISGPASARKTLFYRLNGVYENTESFRANLHSEQYFIAPYLLWRPNASTSLAVLGEFINVNRASDYGLALLGDRPAPVPVSTNYTEPWNNEDDRDRQVGYRFNHEFNSKWTLANGLQISRTNARYLEVYTTGPDTNPLQLTRLSDAFYFPTLYRFSQTTLLGLLKTAQMTHHIAIGFEAGWVTASSEGPGGYAPDVSVLNPVIGSDFTQADAVAALANPYFKLTYKTFNHNQSVYAQDQVDLDRHWKAIVGLRFERFFQDSINQSNDTFQTQKDFPVSPRAGLVYEPASWLSVYGSYVRSFIPTNPTAVNSSGKQFSPEYDHQWEAGIKIAPSPARISMTVALFQIEKNRVLAADPANPIFSIQNGKERSKGVEFEFRGSPIRGLNLLTSYAFTQAQVTESIEYPMGGLLPNAPRNSGAIWATYQPPSGKLQNLGLSAGLIATTAREDDFFHTALLPGYARLDLGSYYVFRVGEHQRVRLSVNVQNALDRKYYLASNGIDQIRPGSPTSALAGLSWSWR